MYLFVPVYLCTLGTYHVPCTMYLCTRQNFGVAPPSARDDLGEATKRDEAENYPGNKRDPSRVLFLDLFYYHHCQHQRQRQQQLRLFDNTNKPSHPNLPRLPSDSPLSYLPIHLTSSPTTTSPSNDHKNQTLRAPYRLFNSTARGAGELTTCRLDAPETTLRPVGCGLCHMDR